LKFEDDLSSLKLIDFGISTKYDRSKSWEILSQRCGTLHFMAPEILMKQEYHKAVDIWSVGVVMYILISGGQHPLFDRRNHNYEEYVEILKSRKEVEYPEELGFTKLSVSLIKRMLEYSEIHRFNADQCI